MDLHLEIRDEQPQDVSAICSVTEAAFRDAPYSDHREHQIVDALRKSGDLYLSLVGGLEGEVVGHVALSPVSISDGSEGWFGLGPVCVIPKQQGKGIGSKLINHALARLRESNASGCVVLGDPGYYSRFGFQADPRLEFPGVPPEYFQALLFKGGSPQGEVIYHESFYQ